MNLSVLAPQEHAAEVLHLLLVLGVEGEGLSRAVEGIEDTVHEALDVALGLKVDVQMGSLRYDGDALLRIVQISDALLHPAACQASAALAYFLLADGNELDTFLLGYGGVPACTYYKFVHCSFSV